MIKVNILLISPEAAGNCRLHCLLLQTRTAEGLTDAWDRSQNDIARVSTLTEPAMGDAAG
jgi:hypothetical protein